MNDLITRPCKECGEPIPQTKGKRSKDFCSTACRSNNWQKRKRNITGFKPVEAPKPEKSADTKGKKIDIPKEAENSSQVDRAAIEKQIAEIHAEKMPDNRPKTSLSIKSWNFDQKKRIQELENKLK